MNPASLNAEERACSDDARAQFIAMNREEPLKRITFNPAIFGGKPIIRGHRLAVEHVLGLLAAGHTWPQLQEDFPWLEPEDVRASLLFAQGVVASERTEPVLATV